MRPSGREGEADLQAVPSSCGKTNARPTSPGRVVTEGFRRGRTGLRGRAAVWRLRARLTLTPRRWLSPVPRAANAAFAWIGQAIEAACLRGVGAARLAASAPLTSGVLMAGLILTAIFLAGEWGDTGQMPQGEMLFSQDRLRGGFDGRDDALSSILTLRGQSAH